MGVLGLQLVLRQLCIDESVSHQAVRCGFIFMSHRVLWRIKIGPQVTA